MKMCNVFSDRSGSIIYSSGKARSIYELLCGIAPGLPSAKKVVSSTKFMQANLGLAAECGKNANKTKLKPIRCI